MSERGRGGARSYADALQCYRRAADQGFGRPRSPSGISIGAAWLLPAIRSRRWSGTPAPPTRATLPANGRWAISHEAGDAVAKDLSLARQWYEHAADQGLIPAEIRLGFMNQRGVGMARDEAMAMRWFRLAAEAGNAQALALVGHYYRRGVVVPQDYERAMRLYCRAADKGNPMAAFNIGLLYAEGHGVKPDPQQARTWFEKAVAAGHQPAIERLARLDAACKAGGTQGGAGAKAGC